MRHVLGFKFVLALLLAGQIGFAGEATGVPDSLQNVMAALTEDARPQEMRRANNGAYYALLPNGCEFIVYGKHSAPVVAVQGWMRTGSIHENKWWARASPLLRAHAFQRHDQASDRGARPGDSRRRRRRQCLHDL